MTDNLWEYLCDRVLLPVFVVGLVSLIVWAIAGQTTQNRMIEEQAVQDMQLIQR